MKRPEFKHPLWNENETNLYTKCLELTSRVTALEEERDTLLAKLASRNKKDMYGTNGYTRLQKKLNNFPVIPMMRAGWEEKRLEVWHRFARNVYRWRDDYRGKWKE